MSEYQWDVYLSHASKNKPFVEQVAIFLKDAGLKIWFDKWIIKAGDSIPEKIEEGLKGSARLILFLSPASMVSKWVGMERDAAYFLQNKKKMSIVPVLLETCEINILLESIKYIDFREPSSESCFQLLEACGKFRHVISNTEIVNYCHKKIPASNIKINLDRLPNVSGKLFGREMQLEALDLAWDSPEWKIWVLVAEGGVGKTGLVMKWLDQISMRDFAGAEWVFGWSFYSQGSKEDNQASSDVFLATALSFFDDSSDRYSDARVRGRRLAEWIGTSRGLLVLDGLEPLQYPPGAAQLGCLRDPGIDALLKGLAYRNPGLCVVTTRVMVNELVDRQMVQLVELEHLTVDAGAELLASYKLKANQQQLEDASKEYEGHALALNLLGSYLVAAHGGDIRRRDKIRALTKERNFGSHAKKVMACYEIWLKDKPELALLYLMGLFDRPAESGAIQAVLKKTAKEKLLNQLPDFDSDGWHTIVSTLRKLHLLAPATNFEQNALDCHPLVREYFGEQLKTCYLNVWKYAHRNLFNYFCTIPNNNQPDTIEELLPLYRAIHHGCQAGLHHQVFHDVYWKRILREERYYSLKNLGAFGLDLGAMAAFFEEPWQRLAVGLSESDQSFILDATAFRLQAGNRIQEAVHPCELGFSMRIQQKEWKNAAWSARTLSELNLACANLPLAIALAILAVKLADSIQDATFAQISYRTIYADALHQFGALNDAKFLFQDAEERLQRREFPFNHLYSIGGYRYNSLLLTQGEYQKVIDRIKIISVKNNEEKFLLPIALDQLILGQSYVCLNNLQEAGNWLNQAVDNLWLSGQQHHVPRGLIARANWYRLQKSWQKARLDLDEAWEISQRGGMKFFDLQLYLEESKLALSRRQMKDAKHHLNNLEPLIQDTGFFLFAPQADELRKKLGEQPRLWDQYGMTEQINSKTQDIFRKYFLF